MNQLLEEFKQHWQKNLIMLNLDNLSEKYFSKTGIHPKLGTITLSQLISIWTVHDLGHTAQIARVMCKQFKKEVGWFEFMGILTRY